MNYPNTVKNYLLMSYPHGKNYLLNFFILQKTIF
jgi:hypothetical protein